MVDEFPAHTVRFQLQSRQKLVVVLEEARPGHFVARWMENGVGLKRKTQDNPSDEDLDERLQSLGKRLGKNQDVRRTEESVKSDNAGFGNALRLSTEFVAAILVGAAIGYAIDWLAGTTPWAMIVFLLLGFVSGVLNVLRAAGEISHPGKPDEE